MRADNLTSQAASLQARELLDEAVHRLRTGYMTDQSLRGTELRIEAARGYLWLAQVESAELTAGSRAVNAAFLRREVSRGLVPGGTLEPEGDGGTP